MERNLAILVIGVFLVTGGTGWASQKGHGPKGKAPGWHQNKEDKKTGKADDKRGEKTADSPAPRAMQFRGLDANNDGIISRREWRGNDVSFREHDWNHDGMLSGDEVRPGARQPGTTPSPRFAEFDRNRNGIITRDEWRGDVRIFDRLDTNRNGVLSPVEFSVRW